MALYNYTNQTRLTSLLDVVERGDNSPAGERHQGGAGGSTGGGGE